MTISKKISSKAVLRIVPYVKDLIARIQADGERRVEQARHRLLLRPSREDVFHAFRLILGREPENDSAIVSHLGLASVSELRLAMLKSQEFWERYISIHAEVTEHPNVNRARRTVVFIHFQKTGGTSFRKLVEHNFPSERRCPILDNKLHVLSLAELGRFDFFAGHFDASSLQYIPRDNIDLVAVFREPIARLISLYRFLRSHPAGDEFSTNHLVQLAHKFTAEEFFEQPELRGFSEINNHYLFGLGSSYSWFDQNREHLTKEALLPIQRQAEQQIVKMASLGITENFDQSLRLMCRKLSLRIAPNIEAWNVTDRLFEVDTRFRKVESVQRTARLEAAMSDLVAYDSELYRYAVQDFDSRCAEACKSRSAC